MEKDFKTPAAQFFNNDTDSSTAAAAETETEPTAPDTLTPPEGYRLDPKFIEKRTKGVHLLLPPSLHKKIQKAAKKQKISFNEWIIQMSERSLTENEKEKKK